MVVAIDCGANVGVHTIEWAGTYERLGRRAGDPASISASTMHQLAAIHAINNCRMPAPFMLAAFDCVGAMKIPAGRIRPAAASFGSLELKRRAGTEFIGYGYRLL